MLSTVQILAGLASVAWGPMPAGFTWDVSPGLPPAAVMQGAVAHGMVPAEQIFGGAPVWPQGIVVPPVSPEQGFPRMYYRVPARQLGQGIYHNPAAPFSRRSYAEEKDPEVQQSPSPVEEVVVAGSAPVGNGTPGDARDRAIRQALRAAVEKVAGVYVSSDTITQKFAVLQERISLHSEGFAVPGDVIEESTAGGVVTVRLRVRVSVRPLVGRLRELGLTRSWKVAIALRDDPAGIPGAAKIAEAEITRRILGAGFSVVHPEGVDSLDANSLAEGLRGTDGVPAADLLVSGTTAVQLAARAPVTIDGRVVGVIPIYQARLDARAIRLGTRDVVAARHTEELVSDRVDAVAAASALEVASRRAARLFLDDILVLPASTTRRVVIEVEGFERRARAQELEEALSIFPGIRSLGRREYTNGLLTLETDVDAVAAERLGTDLESAPGLKEFGLTVDVDTKARIRARVSGS